MRWEKIGMGIFLVVVLSFSGATLSEAKTFGECPLPVQGCLVVSSALVSAPYFVSKMIYAVNGSIVAGGITILSLGFAQNVATTVGCQAVNGDWIVHPEVFTGGRGVEFVGKDEPVKGPSLTMKQKE